MYFYGNHIEISTYIDDIVSGIDLLVKSKKFLKKTKKSNPIQVYFHLEFLILEIESVKLMDYIKIIEKNLT